MNQLALIADDFYTYPPGFFRWIKKNQHIYRKFTQMAFEQKRLGRKQYSARAIVQRMRWDTNIRQAGDQTFKINNIFTPGLARLAMRDEPELKGFFRCRDSQGMNT